MPSVDPVRHALLWPRLSVELGAAQQQRVRVGSGAAAELLVVDRDGWLPAQQMGADASGPWFHVNLKTREISITGGPHRDSGAPALPLLQGYSKVETWAAQLKGNGEPFRIFIEG